METYITSKEGERGYQANNDIVVGKWPTTPQKVTEK